jgi:hypothetical protein
MIDPELAAEITQEHEVFLTQLEGLAIQAIATNNWVKFYAHVVDFQNEHALHGETVIAKPQLTVECPTVGHSKIR